MDHSINMVISRLTGAHTHTYAQKQKQKKLRKPYSESVPLLGSTVACFLEYKIDWPLINSAFISPVSAPWPLSLPPAESVMGGAVWASAGPSQHHARSAPPPQRKHRRRRGPQPLHAAPAAVQLVHAAVLRPQPCGRGGAPSLRLPLRGRHAGLRGRPQALRPQRLAVPGGGTGSGCRVFCGLPFSFSSRGVYVTYLLIVMFGI